MLPLVAAAAMVALLLAVADHDLPLALCATVVVTVTIAAYLVRRRAETELANIITRLPDETADQGAGRAMIGVEVLGDPALLVGGDLRVISANAAARGLFGDRVVADDLRLTLRHPAVLDAVRLAPTSPGPIEREVTGLGTQNGAYRVRVARAGADGGSIRLLLTFVDVTQARMTERMRVDFIANASHELRTPLATLLGFIETLLGPAAEDEPARRRFLEIMSREAARMSRLIDDLLSLSRIELDKYVRPQTALDLAPAIADVGRTLAMRLEADRRRLVIHIPEPLPQVVADRDQILQVLHNLVSNALKYGRAGTAITVSAERIAPVPDRNEAMVRVMVSDHGDGIAPEHLPRLTERFYRIDTSRSRSMGGTGLGLAIVKHIVERHRGQFEIISRPGDGTDVSFTLPLASAEVTVTKV
ncbi:MAG: sensor histidine kinase [Janthinobacterium lividum]